MAVTVIHSTVYGSTEEYSGDVYVYDNVQGDSKLECA